MGGYPVRGQTQPLLSRLPANSPEGSSETMATRPRETEARRRADVPDQDAHRNVVNFGATAFSLQGLSAHDNPPT